MMEKKAEITIIDTINPKIDDTNLSIDVSGKVYDLKIYLNNAYANFTLNYNKDYSINIYVDTYNWKKLQNVGFKIKNGDHVTVTGYPEIGKKKKNNKFALQIRAKTISHYKPSEPDFYCAPNPNPKPIPKEPQITLISNKDRAGTQDFIRILSPNVQINETESVPLEGDEALEKIPEAIEKANTDPDTNLICLVRGGGDAIAIRYVFDNKKICEAIKASEKPVLVGVGHTKDFTNADRASDAPILDNGMHKYSITPTDLAKQINSHCYKNGTKGTTSYENTTKVTDTTSYNKYLVVVIVVLLLYIFFVK